MWLRQDIRKYILLSVVLGGLFLIVHRFTRAPSAPVTITLFKPERGDRQLMFVITNSTPKNLTWTSIVEVGGPDNWYQSGTQLRPANLQKPANVSQWGDHYLKAHTAYWFMVSVPEERGTWRVRCVVGRELTVLEKRFAVIFNKLGIARWSWSVTSPSITADAE